MGGPYVSVWAGTYATVPVTKPGRSRPRTAGGSEEAPMKKLSLALGAASIAALTACGDDTVVPVSTDAATDYAVFEASTADAEGDSEGPGEEGGGPHPPRPTDAWHAD